MHNEFAILVFGRADDQKRPKSNSYKIAILNLFNHFEQKNVIPFFFVGRIVSAKQILKFVIIIQDDLLCL